MRTTIKFMRGESHLLLNVPNALTMARLIMTPFIVVHLLYGSITVAVFLTVVAAVSDLLDGYIARKWQCKTETGELFDTLVDKIFVISVLATLTYTTQLWKGFVWLIAVREVGILAGKVVFDDRPELAAALQVNFAGKVKMTLQCILVPYVMLQLPAYNSLATVTAAVTFYSGVLYLHRLWNVLPVRRSQKISKTSVLGKEVVP